MDADECRWHVPACNNTPPTPIPITWTVHGRWRVLGPVNTPTRTDMCRHVATNWAPLISIIWTLYGWWHVSTCEHADMCWHISTHISTCRHSLQVLSKSLLSEVPRVWLHVGACQNMSAHAGSCQHMTAQVGIFTGVATCQHPYAVQMIPDSKAHVAHMGPTWVLSTPGGPHVGLMKLAIGDWCPRFRSCCYISAHVNTSRHMSAHVHRCWHMPYAASI